MSKKKSYAKYLMGGSALLDLFGNVADAENNWSTAQYNGKAAKAEASEVEESGALTVRQLERQGRAKVGSDLASIVASNTAFSGSALDIMADTAAQLALEKKNQERETSSRARALRNQASNTLRTGAMQRAQGYLKASGSLLTSTKDLLDMF